MNRITISVTPEIEQAMRREARRRGSSVSAVARDALGQHLHLVVSPHGNRHVGFAALGNSNEPGAAERVEEILAAEWGDPDFDRDR